MILLPTHDLPEFAARRLTELQSAVDALVAYPDRVLEGKRLFRVNNVKGNRHFDQVKVVLDAMCCGARRCAYCEDSAADEVEHIKPKDFYPEHVFDWANYAYACGPCNGPKCSHCAVVSDQPGYITVLERKRVDPVVAPPSGPQALINPRAENALDFLMLDLTLTYTFQPIGDPDSLPYIRAKYTVENLHLNDRDYLCRARAKAHRSYKALLYEYVDTKLKGGTQLELENLALGIQGMSHPTVWKEMQRQHAKHESLMKLFGLAPEALTW